MIDYNKSKLSVFCAYIASHKADFIKDMSLSLAVALVDLAFPYVTRHAMNTLLPDRLFTLFFAVMAILFAAYLLRAWFQYLVTVIGHRMGTAVEADMRRDVFTHMQTLSFSFFDRNRTGVLLARVTNDLFEIVELAHHGPENLLTCGVTLIGAVIILLTINWRLALVLILLLPFCIWFAMRQRLQMQAANRDVKVKTGEINAAIESGISGIRTSKAFANEEAEESKFDIANEAFKKSKVRFYRAMGLFNAVVEGSVSVMQVAVITFGGFLIMRGELNFVDLLTFTLYITIFVSPIRKLMMFMEIYASGSAGFDRFLEIMRTQPEIRDAPGAEVLSDVKGDVRLDHVCFSYKEGTSVPENVSLHVSPGETFALVGSSGGGKTTICHLIPRFYDVTDGAVLVDGKDVRSLTQESLRHNIGIIQQDVFLFAGTIMENIRYGRPDATDKEVIEAAIHAEIHDDIMAMPDAYQSYVGERGVILSGGQKQRISIARALLARPRILLLDDATSAVDPATERALRAALREELAGTTVLTVAQRAESIREADRIVVLDGGAIVGTGSHEELLRKCPTYAEIVESQSTAATAAALAEGGKEAL
jgi:ATP-binding cassette subfamily B protein